MLAVREGSYRRAAELLACTEALLASAGSTLDATGQTLHDDALAKLQREFGEDETAAARAAGAPLDAAGVLASLS